jgi:SAM-dependent methyltransferase
MENKLYVIFGAGNAGKELASVLPEPISYIVDNDPKKWGTYLNGILINKPEKLLQENKDNLRIFIASMYFDQIKDQLVAMGFEKNLRGERMLIKAHEGYCPCCEQNTWFIAKESWLRDYYFCQHCRSIPRFRAIINRIKEFVPNISRKNVYEVAPGGASSVWLKKNSGYYVASHYWSDIPLGSKNKEYNNGEYFCQNLEALTFEDNSFDLVVTQDVFEHIFHPDKALKEIRRVLKPGGYHIFTVPYYRGTLSSRRAMVSKAGVVEHLKDPVFHGNPISKSGSLVTFDWGDDIVELIYKWTGMATTIYIEKNEEFGLEAEFLEVFISKKKDAPNGSVIV